jgi:hypothetical protein
MGRKRSIIIGDRGGPHKVCCQHCQSHTLSRAIGYCLIFFIPPRQTFGLFSVPAPPRHLGDRRGFLLPRCFHEASFHGASRGVPAPGTLLAASSPSRNHDEP